jgi:glutathione S-transferase
MKLFYAPAACSLGPHIIFREAGLDNVSLVKVTFGKERPTDDGAISTTSIRRARCRRWNWTTSPHRGAGPASARKAEAKLAPTEGMARWRLLETLNFISTELHKGTFLSSTQPGRGRAVKATW